MIWLWLGVVLWSGIHFIPSLAQGMRASLIERLGDTPYKIAFALGIVLSIVLMVVGWRSAAPIGIYSPPPWGAPLGSFLVLIAFVLFGAAHGKTNVKRFIRHPQLTGLVMWTIGHLLANGDSPFACAFWCARPVGYCRNTTDQSPRSAWTRPDPTPLMGEIRPIVTGLVIFRSVSVCTSLSLRRLTYTGLTVRKHRCTGLSIALG